MEMPYFDQSEANVAKISSLNLIYMLATYQNGLHKPNIKTVIDAIATDISHFCREKFRTGEDGQRYRARDAPRTTQRNEIKTLWANLDDVRAPQKHFVRSFFQRRQKVVGDCFQLKTDVDVYNTKDPLQLSLQISLDFTFEVEELQLPFKETKAA